MFVRTIKRSTTRNIAVQIVESYRNDHGQPRQRIVRHMGSVPAGRALDELRRLAQLELLKLHEDRQPTVFPARTLAEWAIEARLRRANETALPIADARQLSEEKRITPGFHEVFGALYEQLHLGQLWSSRYRVSEKVFREAVLMRLAQPGRSKRKHAALLSRDHGIEVSLERFYRMMDHLDEPRIERLQKRLGNAVQQLLREPLEVVLMDVTTLSFASEVEDALRRKGYSKDGKPHRVQVVLALVQTKQGLPVGYRLFAGHVSEVKTLEPMIEQLRRQYQMQRVVVVADAAMASQENMAMMKARGLDWVVAARLRNMSQSNLEQIRHSQDWHNDGSPDQKGRQRKVLDITLDGRRLVVRYCPKKALKDAAQRARIVSKLRARLPTKVGGQRRRYLQVKKDAVSINEQAIVDDARLDGMHAVWTSLNDVAVVQVRQYYAQLWRIEQGFRVIRHSMAIRPIFHWTERRVRAHVAICYTAFVLLRMVRWKYQCQHAAQDALSEERILEELARVQASVVRDDDTHHRYLIPSSATAEQRRLYATVGEKLPQRTTQLKRSQPRDQSS